METVRIFVGCASNNEDLESQVVLEYTLRKFASQPLQITWMQLSRDPYSPFYSSPERGQGWRTQQWATPFSGLRWAIPALCKFHGKGIYLDSDFIFLDDIAKLWNQPIAEGRLIIAADRSRLDCSVWNCAKFAGETWDLTWLQRKEGSATAAASRLNANTIQPFADGNWNVMDISMPADINTPSIKAIHYTQMHTQPQLKYAIPRLRAAGTKHWYTRATKPHPREDLQALFDREYEEAQSKGITIAKYQKEPYGKYTIRGIG